MVSHPTTADDIEVLLDCWLRFLGQMVYLVVDQQTSLASDELGSACYKLAIARILGGSDPSIAERPTKITRTGMAEKHIEYARK